MKKFLGVILKWQDKLLHKFWSLKFRLMSLITIALIIVVGLPVGIFIYQLDKNYQEFSTNMIETTAQIVYQYIYDGMMHNDSLTIQRNLELLAMEPTIELLRIYRPSGTILYSSKKNEINNNVFKLKNQVYLNKKDEELETFVRAGNIYSHHHPIYVQEECTTCHVNQQGKVIGIMDVQAGFTDSEQIYTSAKKLSIFSAILIIVILWIVTNLLYQGQIESRLRAINNGFDQLALGNLNYKILIPGRHELAVLANKFNQTIGKLKAAKQKEEQSYQEQLERADRLVTLGEVATEIAHEVNNPAGIILSRAEYLKDEFQEKYPNYKNGEDLDIIIQQTEKIAEITRSILHYARKLPHKYAATDLNEVIEHSVKVLQPRIKKRRINIELNLTKQAKMVWGNFNQLEQVFCNLLNNSLDVVPETNGRIQIDIKNTGSDKQQYKIIYKDNGPGIPDEYKNQVFSPFFTTKEDDKGTGLGLFIAKNIINHHKGEIYLQNNFKSGTQFIIKLEVYNE